MATLKIFLDQTDNGRTIKIKDVTEWTDSANTGVTAVTITIKFNNVTYTAINESKTQPCPQSALVWDIPSTVLGLSSTEAIEDGVYEFTYTVTTSPATTPLTKPYLMDYNSKKYVYELYEDASYQLSLKNYAYNLDIKKIQVADVLLKGMQYASATGQTNKALDILSYFEKFKKVWQ